MQNTLQPDVYVLIDKLSPHWAPFHRGEIIVFRPPDSVQSPDGAPFIKRVIGVPGDRVELRDGKVYVNGVALDEPYVFADGGPAVTEPAPDGQTDWLVPAGDLFVLGDHRPQSEDSRYFGPIEISRVVGRAWVRYWPVDSFGVVPDASYPVPTAAP
jgi:signal peptidase I